MNHNSGVPVLLLIFNRPDTTKIVFESIRKHQPKYLYVAADGPRKDKIGEPEKCLATREIVTANIDWTCELKTLFNDENLGCGKSVSGAINWFFENVEEGIILEDDCLPADGFFDFCGALLAKYRHCEKIMHIGGSNFQQRNAAGGYSYYFSNYIHVWGWATWRRAWNLYNFDVRTIDDRQFLKALEDKFPDSIERDCWIRNFDDMRHQRIDTWDYQWAFAIYGNGGIGITPAVNLVSNIGFGTEATHMLEANPAVAQLPLHKIEKIQHPLKITINKKADRYTFKKIFQNGDTRFNRLKFRVGKKFPFIKTIYLKALHR